MCPNYIGGQRAMTGHKDYKLADHYSKLDNEYQREISEKIMGVMREKEKVDVSGYENVIELRK